MSIQTFITLYLISLPVFLVVDLLWIGVFANKFYDSQIGHLRGDINWPAAVAFYLIFLAGLTYYAILPAVATTDWLRIFGYGALYGFFVYAAYDLTNMATLRDWPLLMTVVDMAWGAVLGGSVTLLTVFVYNLFTV